MEHVARKRARITDEAGRGYMDGQPLKACQRVLTRAA